MTRSRLASGLLVSAVVAGVFVAVPAMSASAAPADCPTAFPTAQAVDGVIGTGYTVERGTAPEPFTATILGRINDGIGPGIDMIMADLDSPALTRAGGVWAGMSGSPVYAADGRLIGSVSYGLAAASPIAGITPAADMKKLLSTPAGSRAGQAKVKMSSRQAFRIAQTGDVSAEQADEGFRQLPVPVSVSGASRKSTKFLKELTATPGVRVRRRANQGHGILSLGDHRRQQLRRGPRVRRCLDRRGRHHHLRLRRRGGRLRSSADQRGRRAVHRASGVGGLRPA
jgi:hypothetical protein